MKKLLPYIIVFAVTTLATTVMAVVFVIVHPPAAEAVAPADSSARNAPHAGMYGPTLKELQAGDSTVVAAPLPRGGDSSQVYQLALQDERKKSAHLADQLRAVMDSSNKAIAAADSSQVEQRKSMAKVLENMDPTSAARILSDFPDGDVKTCLLTMKKRQAAKILAALQPDRAARIMR
jgi:hypothetical protein